MFLWLLFGISSPHRPLSTTLLNLKGPTSPSTVASVPKSCPGLSSWGCGHRWVVCLYSCRPSNLGSTSGISPTSGSRVIRCWL